VDALKANGPGNSVDTKCDLAIKKDAGGTVMIRWLPSWYYADFSGGRQFAGMAGLFRPGSSYQGMRVRRLPKVSTFLRGLLKDLRPAARDLKVLEERPLPDLARQQSQAVSAVNANLRKLGLPPIRAEAGALAVEYLEGGTRFREALFTALLDNRGAAASWSNQNTVAMRAPAAEADLWRPALDVMRGSGKINPEWAARYARASAQRGQKALDTTRYIARVSREIYEHRAKTHAEIRHEQYLFLTGQEEYVNPYTKEIERDTSEYKYRWTTEGGQRLLTDQENYDPNRVRELSDVEWKRTLVRPR
jgi:hypothetical protein